LIPNEELVRLKIPVETEAGSAGEQPDQGIDRRQLINTMTSGSEKPSLPDNLFKSSDDRLPDA